MGEPARARGAPKGLNNKAQGKRSAALELVDRLRSELYRGKVSTDANAAIEMGLHAGPKLSRTRIAELARIGETTLRGWKTGRCSPTPDTIEKIVSALHAEGPLSDYLAWLRAGRDWLVGKEQDWAAGVGPGPGRCRQSR